MVDLSTDAQLLAAVATALLASATFWLGWTSRQERKSANARELAIGVYNPIRQDTFRWEETEPNYNDQWAETWKSLKRSQLQLAARVPKPITTLLDAVEPDISRANFLKTKLITIIQDLYAKLTKENYPEAQFGGDLPYMYTFIRLIVNGRFVRAPDPVIVWLSRRNLKNYIDEYVLKHYPKESWTLELTVKNLSKGPKRR